MKRKSRKVKVSETPASHNGVYRIEEIASAFKIPRSVVYSWVVQDKLVRPDYSGRPRRPALYLEKTAAAILLIDFLMRAGIQKAQVRSFLEANKALVYADRPTSALVPVGHNEIVKTYTSIGIVRQYAHRLLAAQIASVGAEKQPENQTKEKASAIPKESGAKGSAVPAHHGEPLQGASGLASV